VAVDVLDGEQLAVVKLYQLYQIDGWNVAVHVHGAQAQGVVVARTTLPIEASYLQIVGPTKPTWQRQLGSITPLTRA
jgi:hypothetical protein